MVIVGYLIVRAIQARENGGGGGNVCAVEPPTFWLGVLEYTTAPPTFRT